MAATPATNSAGPQVPGDHLMVPLNPQAQDDLERLQQRTNMSRTDLANRAITWYEFLDRQLRAGRDLIVRDKRTGVAELVQLQ